MAFNGALTAMPAASSASMPPGPDIYRQMMMMLPGSLAAAEALQPAWVRTGHQHAPLPRYNSSGAGHALPSPHRGRHSPAGHATLSRLPHLPLSIASRTSATFLCT